MIIPVRNNVQMEIKVIEKAVFQTGEQVVSCDFSASARRLQM